MEKIEVDLFTDQGNNAVIKLPNRTYPGVVVQGDTLLNLVKIAESIFLALDESHDEKLLDDAEGLFIGLSDVFNELKRVAEDFNLNVPYLRD